MKKTLTSLLLLLLTAILALGLVSCADIKKTGDWETATFTIRTDKENLEDALTEHNLIDGDESAFGLYIKKVNGIVADYDADGSYWAITKSGEETSGAKSTLIADGDCYELTKTLFTW